MKKFVIPRQPSAGSGIVEGDMKYTILRDTSTAAPEPPKPISFTWSRFTKTKKLQLCLVLLATIFALLLGALITWLLQRFGPSAPNTTTTTELPPGSLQPGVGFSGEHYAQLDPSPYGWSFDQMSHSRQNYHSIVMRMRTTANWGLLLWQGLTQPTHHLIVAVIQGRPYFLWNQGDNNETTVMIKANKRINDGLEHIICITRRGNTGTLTVDSEPVLHGTSKTSSNMLTPTGNIFVGGLPVNTISVDGFRLVKFVGCISELRLSGTDALPQLRSRSHQMMQRC